jgi:1,5-anhydro-D-fructose reductase (1,5-anhydro-D-mannitol-forming)
MLGGHDSRGAMLADMTIGWGILGCGDVCERKSGPAFQRATGSRLVAVMRRNRALAQDYATRHGVPRFYDDADALVADPEVDAVYVATPPGSHLEHALRACRAGKPAYVEKPMARNHSECLEMIRAFEQARLPLFVAYYRRALDKFRAVSDILSSGRIGTVTGVTYCFAAPHHVGLDPLGPPWRMDAPQSGGGLLLDLGSHTLDLLDCWFGPFTRVQGHAANLASPVDVEDTVAMSFVTGAGAPGVAHWSFASHARRDCIEIMGTDGHISVPTFGDDPVRVDAGGETEQFDLPNPEHIQQPLVQAVVDAIHGKGTSPSTGTSAARTSAVMDQVLLSYYGTRDGMFWQTPRSWPGKRWTAR